jgi:DNA-binding MarR family transcriptional regulator
MPALSPKDRALLHLYDSRAHLAQAPTEGLTQQGVAQSLDMNRTHVTRVLKPLLDQGCLEAQKGRLDGGERKLTYYVLTPLGLAKAKELIDSLAEERLDVITGSGRVSMSYAEAMKAYPGIGTLLLADSIGGVLRPGASGQRMIDSRTQLSVGPFFGREEQLAAARAFLVSSGTVLAVYANHGYGSSTFMRKVALDLFAGPVLWHDLGVDGRAPELSARLTCFAAKLGLQGAEGLREEVSLICLDNYRDVDEGLVDLLADLVPRLSGGKAKLAVAMREETPSYDRFYLRPDVLSGRVVEVHLHRLDEATAKSLIGEDIDDEAFQLIYMLTRGQPSALAAVRDGDEEALRRIRLSEEVRFLMYLRTRRKGD